MKNRPSQKKGAGGPGKAKPVQPPKPLTPLPTEKPKDDAQTATEDAGMFTPEKELAELLGLTVDVLAGVRESALKEGEHWTKKDGAVVYTAAGLDAALEVVESDKAALKKPREGVVIVRRIVPNFRIVLAEIEKKEEGDEPGALVTVRVPDSAFFRPGARISARHTQGAIWEFMGARPRYCGDPRSLVPPPAKAAKRQPGGKG